MTEFMRSSDAFTWAMESDPRLRSTVVTVLLLEKSPNWDDVRDRIDLISRNLPMFRQRVVESPPPAPPRWESDPDFDLDFHIREMAAPEPGNLGGVLEIARVAEMEDFDRARPLWTVTLIDGLEDAGAAMLCKFHHSLTDGVGGVQIGMTLFDLSELSGEHDPLSAPPKVPRPPWLSGYRDVFGYDAELVATAMAGAITSAPKLIYKPFDP
jgi:diacylglycerol O-acyltransferase